MNNTKKHKITEVTRCSKASKMDGKGCDGEGNGANGFGRKRNRSTNGEEVAVLPARRRRSSKMNDCEPKQQQQQQRVPDPPPALIRLLQTNKKVLNYFTILQKYLHQDVQKWKDRALDYKAKMEEVERQLQQHQQRVRNTSDNTDQQQKKHEISYKSFTNLSNEKTGESQRQEQLFSTRVPITDEMILLELSGEDSSIAADDVSEVTMDNHYQDSFSTTRNVATQNDEDNTTAFDGIESNTQKLSIKKTSSSSIDRKRISQLRQMNNPVPIADTRKTITDQMTLAELRAVDESSTSSHENEMQVRMKTLMKPDVGNDNELLCHEEEEKYQNLQIFFLKLAHGFLTKLGISLITCDESDVLDTPTIQELVTCPNKIKDYHPRTSTCSSSSTSGSDDNFSLGEELRNVAKGGVVAEVNDIHSNDSKNRSTHESSLVFGGISNTKQFRKEDKVNAVPTDNDGLSIPLPEYYRNEKNNNNDGNNPSLNEKIVKKPSSVKRRSDYDIAKNLMQVVRLLVRKISPKWLPFMGKNHTPCYLYTQNSHDDGNSPTAFNLQHPAVQGIQYICKTLYIMNIWATDTSNIPLHETPELIGNGNGHGDTTDHWEQIIQTGMNQRRVLVRNIIKTIAIESTSVWSYVDRNARSQTNYPLRYWPDYETEDTESSKLLDSTVQIDWATNLTRLSSIAERCIYAQILASFYHNHNDIQTLGDVVVEYVHSSVPLLYIEGYPEYPPVLSLCILEAFLFNGRWQDYGRASNKCITWFTRYLQDTAQRNSLSPESGETKNTAGEGIFEGKLTCLSRVLSFAVRATACIWNMRKNSSNSRICDIASVELAAYERLLMSEETAWLGRREHTLCHDDLNHLKDVGKMLLGDILQDNGHSLVDTNIYAALRILLTLLANQDDLLKLSNEMLTLKHSSEMKNPNFPQLAILACVESFMSAIYAHHASASHVLPCKPDDPSSGITLNLDAMNIFLGRMVRVLLDYFERIEIKVLTVNIWNLATSAVLCSLTLRDGDQLYHIAERLAYLAMPNTKTEKIQDQLHIGQHLLQLRPKYCDTVTNFDLVKALVDSSEYPVIRVINLQRRPDRWIKMVVQASRYQLLLVKAVSSPMVLEHSKSCSDSTPPCSCIHSATASVWGQYAFDGAGSSTDFEKRIAACFGGHVHLERLVKSQWRPYMLRPLDRNAKKEEILVRMDPTERACALSHIHSWLGVQRSLTACVIPDHNWSGQVPFLRQFQISGFARGRAIFSREKTLSNDSRTPVCVILEDDAILVDRFSERLEILLNELPSDFHFCSIGYSQPKKAPLFHFSDNLVIPSFLWYLTGYILSLEGASYLLNSLPVDGPVDTWIGMQMLSNFASGMSIRRVEDLEQISSTLTHLNYLAHEENESKGNLCRDKQIVKNLKFRCFAALNPLCSQQTGGDKLSGDEARRVGWRARDTDITYSGYKM